MSEFDKFCHVLKSYNVNVEIINDELNSLYAAHGLKPYDVLASSAKPMYSLNISHPPALQGVERFTKYIENRARLHKHGVSELDFTVINSELDGTYTRRVIDDLISLHRAKYQTDFVGRFQVSFMGPGFGYTMHKDGHTPHRYHIPLSTNDDAFWYFKIGSSKKFVNMPADGSVWYLNAKDLMHGIFNFGSTPRVHLMLTSNI